MIYLHNSGQMYVYRVKRMIIPRWNVSRTKIKQWMLDENANERRESVPTPEIYVQKRSRVIRLTAFSASSSTSKEQRVYNKIMCTGILLECQISIVSFSFTRCKRICLPPKENRFSSLGGWGAGHRPLIDWSIDRCLLFFIHSVNDLTS